MSQPPPFQPPPPPAQPPHHPQNAYGQPAPQQQPPPGFGPPSAPTQPPMQAAPPQPFPGQHPAYPGPPPVQPMYPMQPGPPYQAPYAQQPNASGHPVGAVFLGLFVSVIVSLLFSGFILATYKDQSAASERTLYVVHALLNGALVGALVGRMGGRSNGARIGAAVIGPLGAFFGYTNAIPLILAESQSPAAVGDMMEDDPFLPAKAWWGSASDVTWVSWVSLLGLVVAAAAAWGLAYVVGKRGRRI